jgi:hypothetical protein
MVLAAIFAARAATGFGFFRRPIFCLASPSHDARSREKQGKQFAQLTCPQQPIGPGVRNRSFDMQKEPAASSN